MNHLNLYGWVRGESLFLYRRECPFCKEKRNNQAILQIKNEIKLKCNNCEKKFISKI